MIKSVKSLTHDDSTLVTVYIHICHVFFVTTHPATRQIDIIDLTDHASFASPKGHEAWLGDWLIVFFRSVYIKTFLLKRLTHLSPVPLPPSLFKSHLFDCISIQILIQDYPMGPAKLQDPHLDVEENITMIQEHLIWRESDINKIKVSQ